jgi:hypothetical protein
MGAPSRYILEEKEYGTFEEYWKAQDEKSHQDALAYVNAMDQSRAATAQNVSTPPPAPAQILHPQSPRVEEKLQPFSPHVAHQVVTVPCLS